MPKFLTIGYGDRAGYERTEPSVRAAHEQDERLRANSMVPAPPPNGSQRNAALFGQSRRGTRLLP